VTSGGDEGEEGLVTSGGDDGEEGLVTSGGDDGEEGLVASGGEAALCERGRSKGLANWSCAPQRRTVACAEAPRGMGALRAVPVRLGPTGTRNR